MGPKACGLGYTVQTTCTIFFHFNLVEKDLAMLYVDAMKIEQTLEHETSKQDYPLNKQILKPPCILGLTKPNN